MNAPLCLALLAYVATAFVSHANLLDVAKGTFIPKLPRKLPAAGTPFSE